MKLGTFTAANDKGQIVIPSDIRKALGIDARVTLNVRLVGGGIYIYPVEEFITKVESESSYSQLLEKTKGAWARSDERSDINVGHKVDHSVKKQKSALELKASKARKDAW